MKKVLVPLPSYGFDPTETAIPWKIMRENNIDVTFITPDGKQATTDEIMLTGKSLGVWKRVLAARKDAVQAHDEMIKEEKFMSPLKYTDVNAEDYDGLLLPGGHDKRVIEYLESTVLQNLVVDFFAKNKPVAAICHGVVLMARSIDSATGKSVICDYKTTCLLKSQEMLGYNMTKLWLKDYYLTYPGLTVEDEVKSVMSSVDNFSEGPFPIARDTAKSLKRGFIVQDRNYLSARWPGDAYRFSTTFVEMIM